MSSATDVAQIQEQAASQEAAALLEQLAGLPGVSGVNPKPISTADRLNHFGVSYKLRIREGKRTSKRAAVTEADGGRPTFMAAVKYAIDSTTAELKEHGVQINTDEQDDSSRQSPARIFEPYDRLSSFLLRMPRACAHGIEPHTEV